jgi:hypothetical protein
VCIVVSQRLVRGRRLFGAVGAAFMAVSSLPLLGSWVAATPATDGNPDLPPSCGLDVTLVLDDSGSIDANEAEQVRQSAQSFADALVGTPSRIKTVVFSTRAQGINASGTLTPNLNNIVFRDPAAFTSPTSGAGSGGTNWDDGLEVARRSNGGPGDLVVFITDGDPTYRNTVTPDGHLNDGTHSISGTGSSTSAADLSQAVTEANLIKASGTKMFGIGIGLTSSASKQRLRDVTGDEEMTITGGVPTPPFSEADFIVTPNFNDLQTVVSAFVRELCADSVNITKFLQRADGSTVKAADADPWEYTLTLDPAPVVWDNPPTASGSTASLTTNGNGGVSFTWDQGANPQTYVADIVETPKPGWVYNGARCSVKELGGATTPLFDTVGVNVPNASGDVADLLDIDVPAGAAVNCEVYNREIRSSTVKVQKQTVPAGLAGDFSFELRQGATVIDTIGDLSHGESGTFAPIAPGSYSVVEATAPGFTLSSAVCDDLGTPAIETEPASGWNVGEGKDWRCTFTNTANNGTITVVKSAIGADGTFPFTSNVPGFTSFSLTTSGGSATSSTVSVPVGVYSITEQAPSRWTLADATCTGGDTRRR